MLNQLNLLAGKRLKNSSESWKPKTGWSSRVSLEKRVLEGRAKMMRREATAWRNTPALGARVGPGAGPAARAGTAAAAAVEAAVEEKVEQKAGFAAEAGAAAAAKAVPERRVEPAAGAEATAEM